MEMEMEREIRLFVSVRDTNKRCGAVRCGVAVGFAPGGDYVWCDLCVAFPLLLFILFLFIRRSPAFPWDACFS